MQNRAIFLDRDGVINEVIFRYGNSKPSSPWNFLEFNLIRGIKKPIDQMLKFGYHIFVVSNQPDIKKGYIKNGTTERINSAIRRRFPVSEIMVCPHDDNQNCLCRKPKPGMILASAQKWNIDLSKSFMIGDN
jgi:D-glycero-D-manno-heptose 1,7-bisphosphate phosphatase